MLSGFLAGRQRDAAMRRLYTSSEATSKEILEVEFGHFPPKGLDYDGKNNLDRPVRFKSIYEDKESGWLMKGLATIGALGYVHGKPQVVNSKAKDSGLDETIYMNPLLLGAPGKAGALYITYGLGKKILADVSLAGISGFFSSHILLSGMLFGSTLRHLPLVQLVNLPFQSFSDIMGHEHLHILQLYDERRSKTGVDLSRDVFKNAALMEQEDFPWHKKAFLFSDRLFSFGTSTYLLNDVEVQARMHTMIANGYHRWGRLPRTQTEFWAACMDSGLSAPAAIKKEVLSSKEEGPQDFLKPGLKASFSRAARRFGAVNTVELNVAQRRLLDDKLIEDHWHRTLPFMYGHLLELYGDQNGLSKMGFALSHRKRIGPPSPGGFSEQHLMAA